MPEWAREHRECAGDQELAEQNDCCAVKLICMIKGNLIATLSCGVLIIRYRIIKGRAPALFWLDWYTLDFWGGGLEDLFAAKSLSVKSRSGHTVRGPLAFSLKHKHVLLFLSYFSPQGWNCTVWIEGLRAEEEACLWPVCGCVLQASLLSFFLNNNKWWMFHIRKRCRKSNLVSSFGGKHKTESWILYHSANLSL